MHDDLHGRARPRHFVYAWLLSGQFGCSLTVTSLAREKKGHAKGGNRNSSERLLYVHGGREEDPGMYVHSKQRLASVSRVAETSTSLVRSGPLLGKQAEAVFLGWWLVLMTREHAVRERKIAQR